MSNKLTLVPLTNIIRYSFFVAVVLNHQFRNHVIIRSRRTVRTHLVDLKKINTQKLDSQKKKPVFEQQVSKLVVKY